MLATPVDFRHMGPLADVFSVGRMDVDAVLDADGNVPPSIVVQGFRSLTPTAEVTRYVTLWERLWNDEYVASYQAMTGWSDDHVPFPGAAARQTVEMLVRENGMVNDRLTVGGDPVHLGDVRVPFLTVRADRDHIVPAGRERPADRPRRVAGQARALPRRRAHGPGRRPHGRQDDGADDPRLPAPAQRRGRQRARRRRPEMPVVELGPERCEALVRFFAALPEGDLTFIEEEVTDPATVRSWASVRRPVAGGSRWTGTTR